MTSIAVLASGGGSNLQALLDAARSGALGATVAVVVADRPCGALTRAEAAGVRSVLLPLSADSRREPDARLAYDRRLADVLAVFAPDLVVLAGWMLLLSPQFLDRFPGRVVNVHPALLPDDAGNLVATSRGVFPALRGAHAVRDALSAGTPITGASVHLVTEDLDAGPVLLREEVPILPGDDEATLHARIKSVEHRLLPQAVAMVLGASERPAVARTSAAPAHGKRGLPN